MKRRSPITNHLLPITYYLLPITAPSQSKIRIQSQPVAQLFQSRILFDKEIKFFAVGIENLPGLDLAGFACEGDRLVLETFSEKCDEVRLDRIQNGLLDRVVEVEDN